MHKVHSCVQRLSVRSDQPHQLFPWQKHGQTEHPQKLCVQKRLSLIFSEMQSYYISLLKAYQAAKPSPEAPEWVKWDSLGGWQHEMARTELV